MRVEQLRSAMVAGLLAGGRIVSAPVEQAFRAVPRHLFLPELPPDQAYRDEAVATKWADGVAISSASQPSMMAIMLEQLDLRPGHRVLEVGAGTGYNAALMARLVGPTGRVVAVDIDADLVSGAARNLAAAGFDEVAVATRDGALGYPEFAPYDRIVLTVGSWDIQPAWWRQLAPGGRLLLPLSVRGSQLAVALDADPGPPPGLRSTSVRGCAFVRLRGRGAGPDNGGALTSADADVGLDGVSVQHADDPPADTTALRTLLGQPGHVLASPVRLAPVDLWDGLGLWLAVREPGACRLLVTASAAARVPSLLPAGMDGGTMALLDAGGLAVLAPTGPVGAELERPFPVAVRAFGPGGTRVADRLARLLAEWHAAGRPAATELSVRAHPVDTDPPLPGPGTVIRKRHSALVLDWPGNPVVDAPILER